MTPTPEQNAKRFIELSENVSVLSTTETNAVILAKAYLALETELQQLRLAADGMRDALKETEAWFRCIQVPKGNMGNEGNVRCSP